MGTNDNKSGNRNSGSRVDEQTSRRINNRDSYTVVEKRAVKNPVPGDGGKKK